MNYSHPNWGDESRTLLQWRRLLNTQQRRQVSLSVQQVLFRDLSISGRTMGYRLMEHDSQNGRQKFVATQALLLFPWRVYWGLCFQWWRWQWRWRNLYYGPLKHYLGVEIPSSVLGLLQSGVSRYSASIRTALAQPLFLWCLALSVGLSLSSLKISVICASFPSYSSLCKKMSPCKANLASVNPPAHTIRGEGLLLFAINHYLLFSNSNNHVLF